MNPPQSNRPITQTPISPASQQPAILSPTNQTQMENSFDLQSNPTTKPSVSSNSKFIPAIWLMAFISLLIAGGIFAYQQYSSSQAISLDNSNLSSPIPQVVPSPVLDNWETHISSEFTFHYPPAWTLHRTENGPSGEQTKLTKGDATIFLSKNMGPYAHCNYPNEPQTLDAILFDEFILVENDLSNWRISTTQNSDTYSVCEYSEQLSGYSQELTIGAITLTNPTKDETVLTEFTQILASFTPTTEIPPLDTSSVKDWSVYIGEDFRFLYPPNYKVSSLAGVVTITDPVSENTSAPPESDQGPVLGVHLKFSKQSLNGKTLSQWIDDLLSGEDVKSFVYQEKTKIEVNPHLGYEYGFHTIERKHFTAIQNISKADDSFILIENSSFFQNQDGTPSYSDIVNSILSSFQLNEYVEYQEV